MKKTISFIFCIILIISIISILSFVREFSNRDENSSNTPITPPSSSSENDIDFSNVNYVAFGDSITYGADYAFSYAQMANPYPELVAETLGFDTYENKGISGATFCENTCGRVCMTDNILSYKGKAEIISVMLGVNDYAESLSLGDINDRSKQTIYGCLNLIAEYLSTEYKDSFVFFMTPYKTTLVNDVSYPLENVAKAVQEVATKYGIPVLDMYNLGQYELEMYNSDSDGIHPSQKFIAKYTAPQISDFIRKNYA